MATFVFQDVSWDLIWSHGTIILFALFQSLMLSLVGHCKHAQWRMFEFEPGVKIFYWASKDIRKCHQALQCINVSKPIQWITLLCKRVKNTILHSPVFHTIWWSMYNTAVQGKAESSSQNFWKLLQAALRGFSGVVTISRLLYLARFNPDWYKTNPT